MERELKPLCKQYCTANGIYNADDEEIVRSYDFCNWLYEMQKEIGPRYLDYLHYLGFDYHGSSQTAEIGKGYYDSLVLPENNGTTMISPPHVASNIRGLKKLMLSKFVVIDCVPYLSDRVNKFSLKYGNPFYNFVTQNPYGPSCINGWAGMHNVYGFGVLVGVFGKTSDRDRLKKYDLVKDFAERLSRGDATVGYDEDGQYYFCAAGTKHMQKGRELMPHRPHRL